MEEKSAKKEYNVKKDLLDLGFMTLGAIGGGVLSHGIVKKNVDTKNPIAQAGLTVLKTGAVLGGASIGLKISDTFFDGRLKDAVSNFKTNVSAAYNDKVKDVSDDETEEETDEDGEEEVF